ncbi:MAG: hypothetical protein ACHQ1E_07145 [Ktedonobacterales bacterium]
MRDLHGGAVDLDSPATPPARRYSWYDVARLACALIILLVIALDVTSIPAAYHLVQTPCSPCDPNSIQATTVQTTALQAEGLSLQFFAFYTTALIVVTELIYIGLGVIIFLRRSDDGIALLTALTLVTFGGAAFTGTMHALANVNGALDFTTRALNVVGQAAFIVFLYVFPDGRFRPRWTIMPAILWSASWVTTLWPVTNPIIQAATQFMQDGPAFVAIILSMIVAQIYRYLRASSPIQRQQTKWVVYALAVGLGGFATTLVVADLLLPTSVTNSASGAMIGNTLTYGWFLIIPVGIAAAILRSRLYDIDILIKRTLVYGSLTAILAALYFGLVIGAQQLTHRLTGQQVAQQPVVIVLSTLLIAALFTPLRSRLQRGIDQRFYRSRYNAARTLAAFSASLRNEVDLAELNAHLLNVVDQTMRPQTASLWLRSPTARRAETPPR